MKAKCIANEREKINEVKINFPKELLINQSLYGLDPYNENLTEEQKQMILIECKENISYFVSLVLEFPPYSKSIRNIEFINRLKNI